VTRSRAAWLAVSVAALAGVSFSIWNRFRPAPGGVLLITLDTLRADYLGCYGSTRSATPNLDALAASGVRFAECTTVNPTTLPTHVSLMTGLYPEAHGVRANIYYRYDLTQPTLAEVLRRNGYRTGAVVGANVLGRHTGLARGFHDYDDLEPEQAAATDKLHVGGEIERLAEEVTDRAVAWIDRNARRQRFFLWVHYFDAHHPYAPPEAFAARHRDDLYAGEVEYLDQQVGRLLDEIGRMGLSDRTLVVAVADHGEGLGEHGEARHGFFLWETTVRVPLIVSYPGRLPAGQVVFRPVGNVDVMPTVLDLVGLAGEGTPRSLLADGAARDVAYSETLYGHLAMGLSRLKSIRDGRWKYIRGARAQLYDLSVDKGETRDVVGQHPDVATRLEARLRTLVKESLSTARRPTTAGASPAQVAQLQSLGYVAGNTAGAAKGEELDFAGPSPMDETGTIAALENAMDRAFQGKEDEAAALLRPLVAQAPWNFGARMQLAQIATRLGLLDEAERNLVEALALAPDHPPSLEALAQLDLHAGRLERALQLSDRLLKIHPTTALPWLYRGEALLRLRRVDEAVAALTRCGEIAPFMGESFELLAQATVQRGDAPAALTPARRAVELMPKSATARATLAAVLARAGDAAGARREAERAAALDATLRDREDLKPLLGGARNH
jgi:arylsulfatase A-like enzyme/Flp pilus assembly protein TadD